MSISEKTVQAQHEYMTHVRQCIAGCDGRGKRCDVGRALAEAVIKVAKQEARR